MELYTPRLHLKSLEETDSDLLFDLSKDFTISQYWTSIRNSTETIRKGTMTGIYLLDETFIGALDVSKINDTTVNMDYGLYTKYTKNGYCKEAVQNMIKYLQNQSIATIVFTIAPHNHASRHFLNHFQCKRSIQREHPCLEYEKYELDISRNKDDKERVC